MRGLCEYHTVDHMRNTLPKEGPDISWTPLPLQLSQAAVIPSTDELIVSHSGRNHQVDAPGVGVNGGTYTKQITERPELPPGHN